MTTEQKLLVFADLDGTVYGGDFKLSDATLSATKRLQRLGGELIITTGNPLIGNIYQVASALNSRHIIVSSGAGIYDFMHKNYIKTLKITPPIVHALTEIGDAHKVQVYFWDETTIYFGKNADEQKMSRFKKELNFTFSPINSLAHHAFKLEFYGEESAIINLQEIISHEPIYQNLQVVLMNKKHLEITPLDATKGVAITWLSNKLDVPLASVMTIGDSPNDLSMLEITGFSYAMDNAHRAVKKIVKYHTADVKQDGFALAIDDYIFRSGYR